MYKVYDSFLNDTDLKTIKDTMLDHSFPWFYTDSKVGDNYQLDGDEIYYDFQLTHLFYFYNMPQSQFLPMLDPIISKLNISAIYRIKSNLTFRSENLIKFPFHIDEQRFTGKTAVFYINTNDGYTELESGEQILSVENRLLTFDAPIKHRGTTHTDSKFRAVINFNYYTFDD